MFHLFHHSKTKKYIQYTENKYISTVAYRDLAQSFNPRECAKRYWIQKQMNLTQPTKNGFIQSKTKTHFDIFYGQGTQEIYNIPPTRLRWNGYGLEIKKSKIDKAGSGLFATDYIPKNTYICEYAGKILFEIPKKDR